MLGLKIRHKISVKVGAEIIFEFFNFFFTYTVEELSMRFSRISLQCMSSIFSV